MTLCDELGQPAVARVHDAATTSPTAVSHATLGPHSQLEWTCWQQVNPVFGVQVDAGPPLSVSQEQLPSGAVCRHPYVAQLHVRPAAGHPRSAQQTPFVTVVLEHAGPVRVFPDWRVHTHVEVPEAKQLPPAIPASGLPQAPRRAAASAPSAASDPIVRPMGRGT